MVNLENKTIKKAGFGATLFLTGALIFNSIISPQIKKYETLRNNLGSMSEVERQYEAGQHMAEFRANNFYEKISNIGERLALDEYYPRRKNFEKH